MSKSLSAFAILGLVAACSSGAKNHGTSPGVASGGAAAVTSIVAESGSSGATTFEVNPTGPDTAQTPPCNGWAELCSRRYDLITFPGTHASAANSTSPWRHPAQARSIRTQLDDSIRALMLEIHEIDGAAVVCSSLCDDGHVPLASALSQVRGFLEDNPREVVTILLELHLPVASVTASFDAAGLRPLIHVPPSNAAWPTLAAMITSGQRLVVLADDSQGSSPQFLPLLSTAWLTRSDFHRAADMNCTRARGDASAPLMVVLHYLTGAEAAAQAGFDSDAGASADDGADAGAADVYPDLALATSINANPFLIERMRGCEAEHARRINIVAVDFYDSSDVVTTSQKLNGLAP